MRRRYLYCYDICDPKRLRRVHKIMKGAGDRVQLSVYECQLTRTDRVHLDERLRDAINAKEDSVLIVDLGLVDPKDPPRYRTMGVPFQSRDRDIIVL